MGGRFDALRAWGNALFWTRAHPGVCSLESTSPAALCNSYVYADRAHIISSFFHISAEGKPVDRRGNCQISLSLLRLYKKLI